MQRAARRERLIGIAMMCGALVCFSGLDSTAKWLTHELPTLEIVWMRYAASVVTVFLFVNPITRPDAMRSHRPGLQLARSTLVLVSTILNFVALHYLQLAQTVSISFSTPLIVAALAGPLLGEWVGPRRMAAVLVGFLGVLVVMRPGLGGLHPAMLLSLGASFCYAFYNITTRVLAAHDSSETTLVYSGLVGMAALTPVMPFVWEWPDSTLTWLLLFSLGVYGALGHWLLIMAHRRAPAAVLSPFIYTQLIWMVLLGFLMFGDVPDHWTVVGSLIVVGSGLYLVMRERAKARP